MTQFTLQHDPTITNSLTSYMYRGIRYRCHRTHSVALSINDRVARKPCLLIQRDRQAGYYEEEGSHIFLLPFRIINTAANITIVMAAKVASRHKLLILRNCSEAKTAS